MLNYICQLPKKVVLSKMRSGIDFSNLDIAMTEMCYTFSKCDDHNVENSEEHKPTTQYIDIEAIKNAILSSIEKTNQSESAVTISEDRDRYREFTLPTIHYTEDLCYVVKSQNSTYNSITFESSCGHVRNISCRNDRHRFADQSGMFYVVIDLCDNINVFFIEHGIFNINDALHCLGKTVSVLHFDNRCSAVSNHEQHQKVRYDSISHSFTSDLNTKRYRSILPQNVSLCTECTKHSCIDSIDALID